MTKKTNKNKKPVKTTYHVKGISDEKLQAGIDFKPHPGQEQVIRSTGRIRVLACGTRWGKTFVAAYLAYKELLKTDKRIWVVAPSYELGSKVFSYLEKFIVKGMPSLASGIKRKPTPRIDTPWGSWLELKSGENPTGMLGEELDLVIVDEASRIKKDVWTGYIFSRLGSRKGKVILISTPFGKNWFFQEYKKAKQKGSAFHFETKDNPYYPKGEWENAKASLPEVTFNQDFRAMFLDNAATVFRNIRDVVGAEPKDYDQKRYYSMGVDLAKTQDYSVVTVIDQSRNEMVYFDRFKEISWPLQKARIEAVAKRYHARVQLDSTGLGDPISDDLKAAGIMVDDFKFTNTSKQQLIEKLSVFIEQKYIKIFDNETILDELESYGMTRTDSGRYQYSAPEGMHDDCVVSLALAVWPLSNIVDKGYNKTIEEDQAFDPHEIFTSF